MRKLLYPLIIILVFAVGCEDILEVPDISDQQVQLLAPAPNTLVNDSLVNFNWNPVVDTEAYIIQIASPNFETPAQLALDSLIVVDSTFVGTRISRVLSDGAYEWRVRARNSAFETDFTTNAFMVEKTTN